MVNLPIEYSEKSVTPFGGMAIMKRFLDQVGIPEKFNTLDLPEPGSNRRADYRVFLAKRLDWGKSLRSLQLVTGGSDNTGHLRLHKHALAEHLQLFFRQVQPGRYGGDL